MPSYRHAHSRRARLLVPAVFAMGATLALAGVPGDVAAQTTLQRRILATHFQQRLDSVAAAFPGVLGAEVVDLTSGRHFAVNDTLVFPQGSAIKIPILIELFRQADRGEQNLDTRVEVKAGDQVGGSGVIQYFADGGSLLSLHDLATLMIVLSDNTATNILIDRLGMANVTRTMARLGYPHIELQREMIHPEASAAGRENLATPAEAAGVMTRIARCDLPMSRTHCQSLRALLEIPKDGPLPRPIPAGIKVAWKPGNITGVATGWGLVELPGRPYVLTVMTNYGRDGEGDTAIETISRMAYDHFARLAGATPYGTRVPLRFLPTPDTSHSPIGDRP